MHFFFRIVVPFIEELRAFIIINLHLKVYLFSENRNKVINSEV